MALGSPSQKRTVELQIVLFASNVEFGCGYGTPEACCEKSVAKHRRAARNIIFGWERAVNRLERVVLVAEV